MDDGPRNVAELLIESKDLSELMLDLAFASVYFDDEELAGELGPLRETLSGYLREIQRICILSAHSEEDAQLITGVLTVAEAIGDIGHAASDIARIVLARLGIPRALITDLSQAEEIVGRADVVDGAACVGRSLEEMQLPKDTGMWIIAIRRGSRWELDPQAEAVLTPGDVLLWRGPADGIPRLRELVGGPATTRPPTEMGQAFWDLDRAVDLLVDMKNSAEAALALAYSALALEDSSLAAEVVAMELESNRIQDELDGWIVRSATVPGSHEDLRGLLHFGSAAEEILDAARRLTSVVLGGQDLHPVLQLALEETEEVVGEMTVEPGLGADGQDIASVERRTGASVLATKRRNQWSYRPRSSARLAPGDRIIAMGSEESIAALTALAAGY